MLDKHLKKRTEQFQPIILLNQLDALTTYTTVQYFITSAP